MASIKDKYYNSFSGGIVRNKSPNDLKDNELQRGRNFEVDEQGRIRKRRGSYAFGQSLSNIVQFHHDGIALYAAVISDTTTIVYKLFTVMNTAAIATTDTTIAVSSAPGFAASGTFEIEGDIVTYTGGGAAGPLTGVSGISTAHAANRTMNQWQSIGALTGHTSEEGVWFGFLNGVTVIHTASAGGGSDISTYDGTTITAASGEPTPARLLEIFRDRAFVIGGTGGENRVYYSNLGDATSWPATVNDNSFEVEDSSGEFITSIKQYRKNLIVSKPSTMYAYSGSLPVRQLSTSWGVFNENCIQEINGLLYGFGPRGIFATNGVSFLDIGQPIKEFLNVVVQRIINTSGGLVSNVYPTVSTAQFDDKFIVFVDDLTEPETGISLNNVSFAYSVRTKKWEMWDGLGSNYMVKSLNAFRAANQELKQSRPVLFFSDGTNSYRAFESRFVEKTSNAVGVLRGTDVWGDYFKDTTTVASDTVFEVITKPFDLGLPQYEKQFGYLKVFSEKPQGVHVSVIIDGGDPIPLGQCNKTIERFKFPPGTQGYRCALVFEESSQSVGLVINGCVFEECKTVDQNING